MKESTRQYALSKFYVAAATSSITIATFAASANLASSTAARYVGDLLKDKYLKLSKRVPVTVGETKSKTRVAQTYQLTTKALKELQCH